MYTLKTTLSIWLLALIVGLIANSWEAGNDFPPKAYAESPVTSTIPSPVPTPTDQLFYQRTALKEWFKKYDCPLTEFTDHFINVADEYGLDWRLLPAISFRESTCGKRIEAGTFNPFGFGYTGGGLPGHRFDSFNSGITYVAGAISGEQGSNAKYYRSARKDSLKILWIYNGTVSPSYPNEVMAIMNQINKNP